MSSHDELGASYCLPCGWVHVALRKGLDFVGDALAVVRIQSTVKLIHNVERSSLDLLDRENQAGRHDCFLSPGKMVKGMVRMLLVHVIEPLVLLKLVLVTNSSGERDLHFYARVNALTDTQELGLAAFRELRRL